MKVDVLLIGGPCDGERLHVDEALPSVRVPLPCKDELGFPRCRPEPGDPDYIPELLFDYHDYQIVPLYGHYLGVSQDMRTGEALAALVRRYPVP